MKVVFAVSEVFPFAKTGGLADVAGALPDALSAGGVDVVVITPLYRCVRNSGADIRPCDPQHIPLRLGPYEVKWKPNDYGEFTLWVVAHDVRGGVSWQTYSIEVRPS